MRFLSALRLIGDAEKLRELSWEDGRSFLPAFEAARDRHQVSTSSGDVVLFQSDQSWSAAVVDPRMGGSTHVAGQILNFPLPGRHTYMFHDHR